MLPRCQPGSGRREQLGQGHQLGPAAAEAAQPGLSREQPACCPALSAHVSKLASLPPPSSSSHHPNPGSSLPLALWLGVLFEVNTPHTTLPRVPQSVPMIASPFYAYCTRLQPFPCHAYCLLLDWGEIPAMLTCRMPSTISCNHFLVSL